MWTHIHRPGFRPVLGAAALALAAGCGGSPTDGGTESIKTEAASGVAASAVAAEQREPTAADGVVIATYGQKTFTEQDLRDELGRLNKRSRKALADPDRRKQFVENFILSDLIFEEGRREGLDQDPDIRRQLRDLERRLVIQKVMQEHQSAPVTDDEVREYYETHADEFKSDRVKASHILVKEESEAEAIMVELNEDPSRFGDLAQEHSIDKSNANRGGDLGFFGRGRMVKEFEEAAFALEEDGQISPIVKTRFGYHIIMRTEREDGQLKSFDDVKNQIRIRLINEKRRSNTQDFLDTLKTSSKYELDEKVLVSIDLSDMDTGNDDGAAAPSGHPHVGGH